MILLATPFSELAIFNYDPSQQSRANILAMLPCAQTNTLFNRASSARPCKNITTILQRS